MKKWKLKKLTLDASGTGKFLGERESEVMEIVWRTGGVTVRDVCDMLCAERKYSFNTIMTIMNRLYEKGLLEKRQSDTTYCYQPVIDRSTFLKNSVQLIVSSLLHDQNLSDKLVREQMKKSMSSR